MSAWDLRAGTAGAEQERPWLLDFVQGECVYIQPFELAWPLEMPVRGLLTPVPVPWALDQSGI